MKPKHRGPGKMKGDAVLSDMRRAVMGELIDGVHIVAIIPISSDEAVVFLRYGSLFISDSDEVFMGAVSYSGGPYEAIAEFWENQRKTIRRLESDEVCLAIMMVATKCAKHYKDAEEARRKNAHR